MNAQKVAQEVIEKAELGKERVFRIKRDILDLLQWVLESVRRIVGGNVTEPQFLSVISELIIQYVKLPTPFRLVKRPIVSQVVRLIDQLLLDRVFGKEWFSQVQGLVDAKKKSS